jgi:nucleoid DNA-binding protein
MRYRDFITAYAQRLDVPQDVAQHLADEFCDEILRQLLLGEDVRLPRLGKFEAKIPKVYSRVSHLPGIKGKLATPQVKKRLGFKPFHSATESLSRQSFVSMVSGADIVVTERNEKARKEAMMAKAKKGEHVTVDLPEGVTQITINVGAEKKRKRGKGESGSRKRKLLG